MRYRSLAPYPPRYIHQFPYKSIRVIAKGSAVLPSRKSAEPFSSYKAIFQHPQAIRAIRHIRIARTPRLLSSCYQTGNPVLKKCVFSRFCSPSHPLFHYSHSFTIFSHALFSVHFPIISGVFEGIFLCRILFIVPRVAKSVAITAKK